MRREIGRWPEVAFYDFSVQIGNHHVLGLHRFIRHSAGLDSYETCLAIDANAVAEGIENEAAVDEFEIGVKDLCSEIVKHGSS